MRTSFGLVAAALLVFSTYLLITIGWRGNEQVLMFNGDIAAIALAFLAVSACFLVYRKISRNFVCERRGWLGILLAFVCFMIADIYWAYFELIANVEVPIGTIADLFYTLGYVFLLFGLFNFMRLIFFHSSKEKWTVFTLAIIAIAAFTYLDIWPQFAQGGFVHVIEDSYVIYDIIVLSLLVLILKPLVSMHNKLLNSWLLFSLGILSFTIFDLLFAWMTLAGVYSTGSFIDVFYDAAYLLVVFSADSKIKNIGNHSGDK